MNEIKENIACAINSGSGIQINLTTEPKKENDRHPDHILPIISTYTLNCDVKGIEGTLRKYQPQFFIHHVITLNLKIHPQRNWVPLLNSTTHNKLVPYWNFLLKNNLLDENGVYKVEGSKYLYMHGTEIKEYSVTSRISSEKIQIIEIPESRFKKNYFDRKVTNFAILQALITDDMLLMKKVIAECDEDDVRSLTQDNIGTITKDWDAKHSYFEQIDKNYCRSSNKCIFIENTRVLWYLFQEKILYSDLMLSWADKTITGQELYYMIETIHNPKKQYPWGQLIVMISA